MKKKRKPRTMENPLAGEMAPPPSRQFYSVGFICQATQKSPAFVLNLMRVCNVEFAWTQDGIGVIRGDDLQKMTAFLADAREEVEDVQAKCAAAPNN